MNKKTGKLILFLFLILLIIFLFVSYSFLFLNTIDNKIEIGIIDSSISSLNRNKVFEINRKDKNEDESHGNEMVNFALNFSPNAKIYYYDASIDGKINDNSIKKGLSWMKEKGIRIVNISLSSTRFSNELESYINEFVEGGGIIYASYNNKKSTFDYPAQYTNVVGVGTKSVVKSKHIDSIYSTSRIFLNGKIYLGNSYLSLTEAILKAKKIRNEK